MINQVFLLGSLVDDPIVDAYEDDGGNLPLTTFYISASYAGRETQQVKVEVMTHERVAEVAAGFKKGQQILVVGELQSSPQYGGDGDTENISISADQALPIEM